MEIPRTHPGTCVRGLSLLVRCAKARLDQRKRIGGRTEGRAMNEDAVARIADGFWVDVRGTDTPDDMMEALATVLAQALSLYSPHAARTP